MKKTKTTQPSADKDAGWARASGWAGDAGWPQSPGWPSQPGWPRGFASPVGAAPAAIVMQPDGREITGDDLLALAEQHIGEKYVLGARAPMTDAGWKGPWDCAEFVSWCLYQRAGILFGTEPRHDPLHADAYTGYWARQARAADATVPLADALVTAGAILLRYPLPGAVGHIAFSDGLGGTIEAHSAKSGVIRGTAGGRRWDVGVMIPGIRYYRGDEDIVPTPPDRVIRLTTPLTRSARVEKIQARLNELGYAAGPADGIYGPQTAHAAARFQADKGLVADGEVGPTTWKALGL